jgi:hypothetical protein
MSGTVTSENPWDMFRRRALEHGGTEVSTTAWRKKGQGYGVEPDSVRKQKGLPLSSPTDLQIVEQYIEQFLSFKYTPHLVFGGGVAVFWYWLMYYHPEVLQTIITGGASIFPDAISLEADVL